LQVGGLTLRPVEVDTGTARFDMDVQVGEGPDGLSGWVEYNTELYDEATIIRMLDHFTTLLEGVVEAPEAHILDLPLLTGAERNKVLVEWNETREEFPRERCIHELFELQVQKTPTAVALIDENEQLTYSELNQRANQLAHHLRTLGVSPEVRVGICVERSAAMVWALLGILKAGGAYVPLDPTYPERRLSLMLEDADLSVLVTEKCLLPELPACNARVVCLDTDGGVISRASSDNPATATRASNLASVIYTSGSTGMPKGVEISHGAVVNLLSSMLRQPGLTEQDVLMAVTSLSFDIAGLEIFLPLIAGARLVV